MEKLALLERLSFGHRVAEDETTELEKYFVETDQGLTFFIYEVNPAS